RRDSLAVHPERGVPGAIAGVDDVRERSADGAGWSGDGGRAVPARRSRSQPKVVALAFMAEREVALVRILGEGDDARGAVLPALLGSDPRLAGDLAGLLDGAGEASCGFARLDAHGGVDAKRSAFPGDGFAIGDLEI